MERQMGFNVGMKRLAAQKTVRPTNFILIAPEAKMASWVGDINHWHPNSNPMSRHFDGSWQIQVPLPHGHHQYAFLVDGKILLESRAQGIGRDAKGQRVSLIAVS